MLLPPIIKEPTAERTIPLVVGRDERLPPLDVRLIVVRALDTAFTMLIKQSSLFYPKINLRSLERLLTHFKLLVFFLFISLPLY